MTRTAPWVLRTEPWVWYFAHGTVLTVSTLLAAIRRSLIRLGQRGVFASDPCAAQIAAIVFMDAWGDNDLGPRRPVNLNDLEALSRANGCPHRIARRTAHQRAWAELRRALVDTRA